MNISVNSTSENAISADQPLLDDDQYGHKATKPDLVSGIQAFMVGTSKQE